MLSLREAEVNFNLSFNYHSNQSLVLIYTRRGMFNDLKLGECFNLLKFFLSVWHGQWEVRKN